MRKWDILKGKRPCGKIQEIAKKAEADIMKAHFITRRYKEVCCHGELADLCQKHLELRESIKTSEEDRAAFNRLSSSRDLCWQRISFYQKSAYVKKL